MRGMTRPSRWPSTGKLFPLSIAVGAAAVLALAGWECHETDRKAADVAQAAKAVPSHDLVPGIDLAAQLPTSAVAGLQMRGYATVIDLRPDGEATDQAPSADMAAAARSAGLRFPYVPVPHGEIPQASVDALRVALEQSQSAGPVPIHCRSGRRAARTWALVQAQRAGGRSPDEIIEAVKASGQDAADLRERLQTSIGQRASKAVGA